MNHQGCIYVLLKFPAYTILGALCLSVRKSRIICIVHRRCHCIVRYLHQPFITVNAIQKVMETHTNSIAGKGRQLSKFNCLLTLGITQAFTDRRIKYQFLLCFKISVHKYAFVGNASQDLRKNTCAPTRLLAFNSKIMKGTCPNGKHRTRDSTFCQLIDRYKGR